MKEWVCDEYLFYQVHNASKQPGQESIDKLWLRMWTDPPKIHVFLFYQKRKLYYLSEILTWQITFFSEFRTILQSRLLRKLGVYSELDSTGLQLGKVELKWGDQSGQQEYLAPNSNNEKSTFLPCSADKKLLMS